MDGFTASFRTGPELAGVAPAAIHASVRSCAATCGTGRRAAARRYIPV